MADVPEWKRVPISLFILAVPYSLSRTAACSCPIMVNCGPKSTERPSNEVKDVNYTPVFVTWTNYGELVRRWGWRGRLESRDCHKEGDCVVSVARTTRPRVRDSISAQAFKRDAKITTILEEVGVGVIARTQRLIIRVEKFHYSGALVHQ